jgi:hypothetical protein
VSTGNQPNWRKVEMLALDKPKRLHLLLGKLVLED